MCVNYFHPTVWVSQLSSRNKNKAFNANELVEILFFGTKPYTFNYLLHVLNYLGCLFSGLKFLLERKSMMRFATISLGIFIAPLSSGRCLECSSLEERTLVAWLIKIYTPNNSAQQTNCVTQIYEIFVTEFNWGQSWAINRQLGGNRRTGFGIIRVASDLWPPLPLDQ